MKAPATYRVLKFWRRVKLDTPFATSYDIIPERKVRSDEMSDVMFEAIVKAVKESGCAWMLYTVNKELIDLRRLDLGRVKEVDRLGANLQRAP